MPAFETADGQYLTESNAIAYYGKHYIKTLKCQIMNIDLRKCITKKYNFFKLIRNLVLLTVADARLRGQSDLEKAQVIQWLGFADSEIFPASCTWVFPCLGILQYNKQVGNVHLKSCNVKIFISLWSWNTCQKSE